MGGYVGCGTPPILENFVFFWSSILKISSKTYENWWNLKKKSFKPPIFSKFFKSFWKFSKSFREFSKFFRKFSKFFRKFSQFFRKYSKSFRKFSKSFRKFSTFFRKYSKFFGKFSKFFTPPPPIFWTSGHPCFSLHQYFWRHAMYSIYVQHIFSFSCTV